jgi:hypothetical protein
MQPVATTWLHAAQLWSHTWVWPAYSPRAPPYTPPRTPLHPITYSARPPARSPTRATSTSQGCSQGSGPLSTCTSPISHSSWTNPATATPAATSGTGSAPGTQPHQPRLLVCDEAPQPQPGRALATYPHQAQPRITPAPTPRMLLK